MIQTRQSESPDASQSSKPFSIALSGGSTPKRLYQLLSELPEDTIAWKDVVLIWGDERNVALDHAESNFRMVKENLLDRIEIPSENVIHVPNPGGDAQQAGEEYERLLLPLCGSEGVPEIDCVLLGMGDDVHTASLFPNTEALGVTDRLAVANRVEKLNTWRITLTTPVLNAGKNIAFFIAGAGKEQALRTLWHGPHDPHEYPSQLIQPRTGKLWHFVDKAAVGETAFPESAKVQEVS